jgi:NAD(P)-dependent dehydrogenase (short-subunit alcohol dehydrogenase family)
VVDGIGSAVLQRASPYGVSRRWILNTRALWRRSRCRLLQRQRRAEAALARRADTVYAAARHPASLPQFSDRAKVIPVRLDVTDQDAMVAAAKDATGVDLLISNAELPAFGPVLQDQDEAAFRSALEVNVFGPLRLVRAFAGTLVRPGTGVICVLSAAAVALCRSAPMYSASKAACLMLALAVREELRSNGATVTTVLPGFMDTAMAAGFDLPKASPMQVAECSLDGWLAGQNTVWPDRFAEVVRDAVRREIPAPAG